MRVLSFLFWVVGSGCIGFSSGQAFASSETCRGYYQLKKFTQAGNCFLSKVKSVDTNKSLTGIRSLLKDRYLRNAAIAFHQAGEQQQTSANKWFWKEKAVKTLQRSNTKGYCKAARRCKLNNRLIQTLSEQIGYGTLVVVTGSTQASILVEGFKYTSKASNKVKLKLRPGPYTVKVQTKGSPLKTRKVLVKRKHQAVVNVTEAQVVFQEKKIVVAKKLPPLVITGYAVGASLAAVGAILAVVGVASQAGLNAQRSDATAQADLQEDAYHRDFDTAGSLVIAGGVASGAGLLVLAGGIVGHVAANRATQTQSPPELRKSFRLQGSLTLFQGSHP